MTIPPGQGAINLLRMLGDATGDIHSPAEAISMAQVYATLEVARSLDRLAQAQEQANQIARGGTP